MILLSEMSLNKKRKKNSIHYFTSLVTVTEKLDLSIVSGYILP